MITTWADAFTIQRMGVSDTLFLHLHIRKIIIGDKHEMQKAKPLLSILLGAGLYLFDSLREQLPDNLDDIKGKVKDTYDTASERVSRASDALRGREDSQILGKVGALAIGVGIGVGIGLLIAPGSGEQTRANINDKVSEFSDKVRESAKKSQGATGTHGE
jgi:gas vesicle protein